MKYMVEIINLLLTGGGYAPLVPLRNFNKVFKSDENLLNYLKTL